MVHTNSDAEQRWYMQVAALNANVASQQVAALTVINVAPEN